LDAFVEFVDFLEGQTFGLVDHEVDEEDADETICGSEKRSVGEVDGRRGRIDMDVGGKRKNLTRKSPR
jgi:hypothetical protein